MILHLNSSSLSNNVFFFRNYGSLLLKGVKVVTLHHIVVYKRNFYCKHYSIPVSFHQNTQASITSTQITHLSTHFFNIYDTHITSLGSVLYKMYSHLYLRFVARKVAKRAPMVKMTVHWKINNKRKARKSLEYTHHDHREAVILTHRYGLTQTHFVE